MDDSFLIAVIIFVVFFGFGYICGWMGRFRNVGHNPPAGSPPRNMRSGVKEPHD